MAVSHDEKQLLLVLREDGMDVLHIIDLATMTPVQTLPLFEVIEAEENGQAFSSLNVQPGFLIARASNRNFVLLEAQGDGTWAERIRDNLDPVEEWDRALAYNDPVVVYDGERLAVAAWKESFYNDSCSFCLAVYDSTGLRCAAEYAHSQDAGQPHDWTDQCRPADVDGLALRWAT